MRASVAALTAFAAIALIDEPTPLDRAAYDWAERHYDRGLELAQRPLEIAGLPGLYIPIAFLVARRLRRHRRRGGLAVVNAALAGWVAVRLSRVFIHRPRPPRPAGRGPKSESTFPSGHTTGVTTLAVVAATVLRDEQMLTPTHSALIGIGLPLTIAANRVYVREHWVTDILGGWTLGLATATAVLALSSPSRSAPPLRSRALRGG